MTVSVITEGSVPEQVGTVQVCATLSGASYIDTPINVTLDTIPSMYSYVHINCCCYYFLIKASATAGSDYISLSTTLEYPPGPANGSMICMSINITDDEFLEGNESFTIRLSNVVPPRVMLSDATVTIIDDDG